MTIFEAFGGQITVLHDGKTLYYLVIHSAQNPFATGDQKTIYHLVLKAQQDQSYKQLL